MLELKIKTLKTHLRIFNLQNHIDSPLLYLYQVFTSRSLTKK